MKSLPAFLAAISLSAGLGAASAIAGPLKEARVTQIIKEVNLLPQKGAARPAVVTDSVVDGTAVKTGVESRTELTFTDQTLTRLGAQTIFTFRGGTRTLDVGGNGAILLNVPKNSGGAKINTAAVTAAITGTTVVLETVNFPKDTKHYSDAELKAMGAHFSFRVLEGEAEFCRKNHKEDCVVVHAGEVIEGGAGEPLGHVMPFDIAQYVLNSTLTSGFPIPLPPDVLALINAAAAAGTFVSTTPPGVTVGNIQTINNTIGTINPANTGAQVVTPEQEKVQICHNGHTISIPRNAAEKHFKNHPEDTLGPCPSGD